MSIDGVGARRATTTQPTWLAMSCTPSRVEPSLLAEVEHRECEDHEDDGAEADKHGRSFRGRRGPARLVGGVPVSASMVLLPGSYWN
jgi:hypothetical protein